MPLSALRSSEKYVCTRVAYRWDHAVAPRRPRGSERGSARAFATAWPEGERAEGIVTRDNGQRSERRPNVIDPEHGQLRNTTLPDARRAVLITASSSHKSMAA